MSLFPYQSPDGSTPDTHASSSGALCVLASGSRGNCSVLAIPATDDSPRRIFLIDAGLSPRRTAALLAQRGIRPDEVDAIIYTHLDTDHCYAGWARAIRPGYFGAKLLIHKSHMGRAERMGMLIARSEPFDDQLELAPNVNVYTEMLSHDSLGVACFRFVIDRPNAQQAHLGYATDCGRVTPGLIGHMREVDTLAIESNYCPDLQMRSPRPPSLKRRIMGGSGHLSNQLSAGAVAKMSPREHLVLLHLSQQCNTPELAASEHNHSGITRTISLQNEPTPWIPITPRSSDTPEIKFPRVKQRQASLFGDW
ncbi:MAG: MBL fold metallo-hydrolase [Phycisphaerales bacterium]|nr:MBL fold metallo-hydrolase [Phycisphaerales bacterium]